MSLDTVARMLRRLLTLAALLAWDLASLASASSSGGGTTRRPPPSSSDEGGGAAVTNNSLMGMGGGYVTDGEEEEDGDGSWKEIKVRRRYRFFWEKATIAVKSLTCCKWCFCAYSLSPIDPNLFPLVLSCSVHAPHNTSPILSLPYSLYST